MHRGMMGNPAILLRAAVQRIRSSAQRRSTKEMRVALEYVSFTWTKNHMKGVYGCNPAPWTLRCDLDVQTTAPASFGIMDLVRNHRHTTDRPTSVKGSRCQPRQTPVSQLFEQYIALHHKTMSPHSYHHLLCISCYPAGQTPSRHNSPHTPSRRSIICGRIPPACPHGTIYQSASFGDMDTVTSTIFPAHQLSQAHHHLSYHYALSKAEHSARW
ncbi:hypothetical protein BD309DRAFT_522134 [Dichomitus squalens]|uniref:Uncharacterized protein n=1 Tax=Dichomitus squalens TaxID=114155 RepID=A0A4Q9NDI4_9APHY|nr:hypothetical protein BD309DRAFT_522134 [Dichomitus squalens]TBU55013.1 hypothetical protein BD310DRAFT_934660 [Dichomitus squalens]